MALGDGIRRNIAFVDPVEPEFLPWHRLLINWFEDLLRVIDPRLSLHYWDWTQDPRKIPNANLGGGHTGDLRLFEDLGSGVEGLGSGVEGPAFMGYGGPAPQPIGPEWEAAGFYNPHAGEPDAPPARTGPFDDLYNAADPPKSVMRSVGSGHSPMPWTSAFSRDWVSGLDCEGLGRLR